MLPSSPHFFRNPETACPLQSFLGEVNPIKVSSPKRKIVPSCAFLRNLSAQPSPHLSRRLLQWERPTTIRNPALSDRRKSQLQFPTFYLVFCPRLMPLEALPPSVLASPRHLDSERWPRNPPVKSRHHISLRGDTDSRCPGPGYRMHGSAHRCLKNRGCPAERC